MDESEYLCCGNQITTLTIKKGNHLITDFEYKANKDDICKENDNFLALCNSRITNSIYERDHDIVQAYRLNNPRIFKICISE